MPQIKYIEGDLFEAVNNHEGLETLVVPHVCNDKGAWGAGFVIPLANAFPKTKEYYQKWFTTVDRNIPSTQMPIELGMDSDTLHTSTFGLGHVQYIRVKPNVVVANMVAQTLGGNRPLSYKYLGRCMERVLNFVDSVSYIHDPRIVAPMFGSGLAGGNWNFIEQMIEDHWGNSMEIHVHYLPQFLPDNWSLPESGVREFGERP